MPAELSLRKRKQIRRFFGNVNKVARLRERAKKRKNREKHTVFHTTIAGEERTVKISSSQKTAKGNLLLLERDHKKAVKKGKIKPKYYELIVVPYAYTDKSVGVMEKVPGVGFDSLKEFLFRCEKKQNIFEGMSIEYQQYLKECLGFCERNPGITREGLYTMKEELRQNLKILSRDKKLFSFDLLGSNNVRITGFDQKTGKFKITLVDQTYPSHGRRVKVILFLRRMLNPFNR